jgi:VWFA-related protein
MSSHESPATFSSRVNLISVPVVVRDREGHAVGTLRKEDFQVSDKGKAQVITQFSIEKAGAPSVETDAGGAPQEKTETGKSPLPDRYIAYLVDDVHLQRGDLLQTRQAMNRHLDESLEPQSRAAIFTTSGQMLADFTDDREKLHRAVDNVQPWSSGLSADDCPTVSYYLADLLMNKFLYFSGLTDVQIAALVVDSTGDQSLIGVVKEAGQCSHLPLNPPPPPHNPPYPPPEEPLIVAVRQAVRQAIVYGERETSLGLIALNNVIRKLSVMPGSRNLVLASPGFLLTLDHRSEESDVFERAVRANVTINTIDMRGVFATGAGGDASQRGNATPRAATFLGQYEAAAATQAADVLAELADGTGGTFFHNNNDLKGGLNLLAARPEYVYVLGFSPQNLKYDGSYHSLKVTIGNPANLTLQARRGYWAPRHANDAAEEAANQIRDAVFSRDEIPDLPLDVRTQFFKSSGDKAEVTVIGRVDVGSLRFRKADERSNDTLTVVAGLFDANGNYVGGVQRVVQLHLRNETLAKLRSSGIIIKETLQAKPGRYSVRMVVRDDEGHTMAAKNRGLDIP